MSNHVLKNLISTWGPRLARQAGLGGLTQEHDDFKIIQSIDFRPHKCQGQRLEKKERYKIAFIIAGTMAYSGGQTSLLRLGTYLTEFGHDVYCVDVTGTPLEALAKNAKINLPSTKAHSLKGTDSTTNTTLALQRTGLQHIISMGERTLRTSAISSKTSNLRSTRWEISITLP